MRVRLIRKLADWIDGIDLSRCSVGDVIELGDRQAWTIVAEQWAIFSRRAGDSAAPSDLPCDRRLSSRLSGLLQRLGTKRERTEQERRHLHRRVTDLGTLITQPG